ncbi:MAG: hypothetical protein UZ12_BCD005002447 [Bacteroidetes bacterium OLB12]|nr:MAG: hypothetical protein UZ12_BCD005002447 [Bacteroidetes bacterium OLB12]
MTKTFTQNDLIRFIYRETSEEETKEINKALLCDSTLQAQYNELNAAYKQLNQAKLEPSAASIQNILNYAHGLQEHT